MAFSLTCPHCHAVLKSAAPIPAGKQVKCAKCGENFAAPAQEEASAVTAAAAAARVAAQRMAQERRDEEEPAPDDDAPRKAKRYDDEPDDRDDDRPVRKPKRKKGGAGIVLLIVGILGGGVLLLVACGGCGGLGWWLYTLSANNRIVGTWEQTNNPLGLRPTLVFQADGRGQVRVGAIQGGFKYKFNGTVLEMESDNVGIKGGFFFVNRITRFNVSFNGNNEMVTNSIDVPGAQPERFRRVN